MRSIKHLLLFSSVAILNFSCDDSTSDEFEEVNGKVETKLISSIDVASVENSDDSSSIIFSYNSELQLNSIFDGTETTNFIYEDGNLANVSGNVDNGNVEELYESPYDAFETGQVEQYDENGNPSVIKFIEYDYDYMTGEEEVVYYTAEISYDDKPNPFYKTAEAAGLIDVMDQIRLNFAAAPQAEEIVRAKALFPNNNPSQVLYKNEEGEIEYTINMSYTYDGDYPTTATVSTVSEYSDENETYVTTFTYLGE
ncbi:MAG TPA: hypothetical protein DCG42_07425 [Maribacter sp.]|uniref:hypothetical protein n=1 Tax=unclassified Maribacter TaxID=2615042 RepID=UPI000ED235B3|nr:MULTISPECIES: hypothetical protein [unclassified Maribacter]HAF77138.1 hypothetical protein [Maribacter sp.]|tara:strand:+ start:103426 stop:104187 length:762 start_codon:yes stop_codon:yes gene_type:complete